MDEALTPEQQASYVRYYLMLRASACSDDPKIETAFDAAVSQLDADMERPTTAQFDEVMDQMATLLGM